MKDDKNSMGRRDFIKASGIAIGGSVLAAANLGEVSAEEKEWHGADGRAISEKVEMPSDAEPALAYGQIHDPELLGDAFNSMVQTYGITHPYQHKFNDALVKAHLKLAEFLIRNGLMKKYLEFDSWAMSSITKRVKTWAEKEGKDALLRGMFEGTGCSFQLFDRIYKRKNERLVVCPFREMAEHFKPMGTLNLTIEEMCDNYCIPRWTRSAKDKGAKVKVKTGKICSIKII